MHQSGVVLRLGKLMLASGAGSYRVKSSMAKAAAAVGLDRHEATVTMTEIVTSSYVGDRFRTEAAEVRRVGVNVARLEALRRLVHDLCAHETVEHLDARLDEIAAMRPLYGDVVNALASGVACAGFCFLNQGGWVECLAVLLAACVGQAVRRQMLERHFQHFFTWLVCGVVASGLYMGVVSLLDLGGLAAGNHQGGIISSILFLIPGFPLVTAMLDLVRQDFSSAVSRASYVLLVMAAAGVAVWTVTFIFDWEVEATYSYVPEGLLLYALRALCSFVAAYGFAILFNAAPRAAGLAAVVGAVANTGRLVLIDEMGVPWQLAVGLAAVTIGLLAQAFVSRASLSRVALSVPAVVIMIPGVPFYRAVSALNDQTVDAHAAVGTAATNLTEVFFVVTAIGVGLAMARILTDRNWRHDVPTSVPLVLPSAEHSRAAGS
ncbi:MULTISPECIES: threonine/serine exporter family protein [unclassified Actinomyces]|uniref:threonine/serine ThrE exporter family protein n=1 Tax=unclassified Actinomyces TaxID=2609248 RepID=UPI002017E8A4|nr:MULTISPECIES: threonine/serine exporter family protein [unclassified Actinomyces]MCL3776807.1 threonine/serine exporter family protein [Actinomyces sp. AC-20-1]MCL3790667.1 threonine/serine exporter family protein [Actinomyces sp. 187325]MCL3792648.1 threonine/serine exporter family protein [Actinomyces sp. 186855]MCL3795146.1 threonine/serine exporter family protein [Actinomyces sp. 217892]